MRELCNIYETYINKIKHLNNKNFFSSSYDLPPQAIFIKDNKVKEILNDSALREEHIDLYWENQRERSENRLEKLTTQNAKSQEKEKLEEINRILKATPNLIKKLENNYDHKSMKEHKDTHFASVLWAISEFFTKSGEFEFYNCKDSKEFEKMVIESCKTMNITP